MNPREYIDFLSVIEKLKCHTRHSWTSNGRHESVAEHSWRLATMAMLCADEYPELDTVKVVTMCLIHDWGEALTGDVPSFYKTSDHEAEEEKAIKQLLSQLPVVYRKKFAPLFKEMNELKTPESKLYKALDNMEAVISHNEAPISTWIEREYQENLIYGEENASWSEWTKKLRQELKKDSLTKIEKN